MTLVAQAVSDGKRPLFLRDLFRDLLGEALDSLEAAIIAGRDLNPILDRIARLSQPTPRGGR